MLLSRKHTQPELEYPEPILQIKLASRSDGRICARIDQRAALPA